MVELAEEPRRMSGGGGALGVRIALRCARSDQGTTACLTLGPKRWPHPGVQAASPRIRSHMAELVIRAARLATPLQLIEDGFVELDQGIIIRIGQGSPPGRQGVVVDLGERLLCPGYLDVHVHGGGGAEVNHARPDEVADALRQLIAFHRGHGTTSLLATTVSDTPDVLRAVLEGVSIAMRDPGSGVLGCHLEGPWISAQRRGAQSLEALRPPSTSELEDLAKLGGGALRLVTMAPELPGAKDVIRLARKLGVVVSLGHTDCDYEAARKAFEAGVTHATHLFNGMPPLHHRHPGPVGAALSDPRVFFEVIADGVHVHPALLGMVAALAPERMVLVTDAIGAAGSPPGHYRLGPIQVVLKEDRVVLAGQEEVLAGSVLTMDKAVAHCVEAGVPMLVALRAASYNPACSIGEVSRGLLAPGRRADIVVLDAELGVEATLVEGRVVHDPTGLFGHPVVASRSG